MQIYMFKIENKLVVLTRTIKCKLVIGRDYFIRISWQPQRGLLYENKLVTMTGAIT
jgi:hypothetical protein